MAGNTDRSAKRSGSPTYWSRLSDDELLAADLRIDDPQTLDNLLDAPPETDEVPEIEFEYDTRMTDIGMVRCIHCKKTAKNHNRGFVLRFADGRRMLFGKDCGEKQYGAVFTLAKRDFRSASKRKALLERRLLVLANKARLVSLLEHVEAARCWRVYGDLKRQYNRMMFEHVTHFSESAERRDGALFAVQSLRDHEAEAEYEKRTGRAVQLFKNVESECWRLKGRDFFIVKELPERLVSSLVHRAKGALWKLGDDAGSDHDLQVFFNGMKNVLGDLREQAERVDALPRAFASEQIEALSNWLQAHSEGNLVLAGRRLFRSNRQGEVRTHYNRMAEQWVAEEMKLPETFPVAPYALLDEIGKLVALPTDSEEDRPAAKTSPRLSPPV